VKLGAIMFALFFDGKIEVFQISAFLGVLIILDKKRDRMYTYEVLRNIDYRFIA
jgi:hypothetical protein